MQSPTTPSPGASPRSASPVLPHGCFQGSSTYKKPLFTGTNCTLLPRLFSVPPKADIMIAISVFVKGH